MTAGAIRGICHLIVILNEENFGSRRRLQSRSSTALLLPFIVLPLIQEPVFYSRDELLRLSQIVGVIRLIAAGQRHHGAVMEVIIPQSIQTIAAFIGRLNQLHVLRLIFADDEGGPGRRFSMYLARDLT